MCSVDGEGAGQFLPGRDDIHDKIRQGREARHGLGVSVGEGFFLFCFTPPPHPQHTTTQNSAAATGTPPLEVRSAPTCLLPPLALDLSAQARPRSRPEGGRRSARPTHSARRRGVARVKKKEEKNPSPTLTTQPVPAIVAS
jgi:hypothetical protein